jgi:hypothetical protein
VESIGCGILLSDSLVLRIITYAWLGVKSITQALTIGKELKIFD